MTKSNASENNDLLEVIIRLAKKLSPGKKRKLIQLLKTWEQGGERRDSSRKDIQIQVDYSVQDKFYSDQLENISPGGAFIRTAKPFLEGYPATMILSHPNLDRNLKMSGEIVRKVDDGIGIRFFTGHKKRAEDLKQGIKVI